MKRMKNPFTPAKPLAPGQPAFVPRGKQRPLFFVHIPKTSGSSWNSLLEDVYGRRNFISHAEFHLPNIKAGNDSPKTLDCVSAHIPLNNWRRQAGTEAYGLITILRDPWARLVSHVNWIDRFNNGKDMSGQGNHADKVAHMASLIAQTDFEDRKSVQYFFDHAHDAGHYAHFDNLQVRMLYRGKLRQMEAPISPELTQGALRSLKSFDGFGICEDGNRFQNELLQDLGQPVRAEVPHKNKSSLSKLRVDHHIARDVLQPWLAADQTLYRRARAWAAERTQLRNIAPSEAENTA
ncbi:sulfotransferase family 2 domain-containing protein [Aestuariibius sp. HNIBRBA575]|uniref:sulfotransferase family 2 domain-containing protein n=1 Tax=Aestuariibius sp. HNIBRBA575 TaxID=3233343 RepID=UPI0034A2063F